MRDTEDQNQSSKNKKRAVIIIILLLLLGLGSCGAVHLYEQAAGKRAAENRDLQTEKDLAGNGLEETEEAETSPRQTLPSHIKTNENQDDSVENSTGTGNRISHTGSSTGQENAGQSAAASPSVTPKPSARPVAATASDSGGSQSSGSGEAQNITVSRDEQKASNGYSFPVYSEITPINLSDYIVKDDAGNNIQLPTDQSTEQKKHTMLIYMCGSDLISSVPEDLGDLISSGYDNTETNVLLMLGGCVKWTDTEKTQKYLSETCPFIETDNSSDAVIYEVKSNKGSKDLNETTLVKVADLQELTAGVTGRDMGNPALLAGFMDFAYENYKADEYSIILWNHGGGISGVCQDANICNPDGMEKDENEKDLLELKELGSAFNSCKLRKAGEKWSFVGMDACLMSSIEVMAVLARYTDYYVASEEVEFGGWNYGYFPSLLKDNDTIAVGKRIVDDFYDLKKDYGVTQTMALIDMNKILQLGDELQAWANDMRSLEKTDPDWYTKFTKARDTVMEFGWNKDMTSFCQIDLIHFLDLLKEQGITSSHMEKLRKLLSTDGTGAIMYQKAVYQNQDEKYTGTAHGVTIYFENYKRIHENKYASYYGDTQIFPAYKKLLNDYVIYEAGDISGEWKDLIVNAEAADNDRLTVRYNEEKRGYIRTYIDRTEFYLYGQGMELDDTESEDTASDDTQSSGYVTARLSYKFVTGSAVPFTQLWDVVKSDNEYWISEGNTGFPVCTTEWTGDDGDPELRATDIMLYKTVDSGDSESVTVKVNEIGKAKLLFQKNVSGVNGENEDEEGTWSLYGIAVLKEKQEDQEEQSDRYITYKKDTSEWTSYLQTADRYSYYVETTKGWVTSKSSYGLSSADSTLTEKSYEDIYKNRNLVICCVSSGDQYFDYFNAGSIAELFDAADKENDNDWKNVVTAAEHDEDGILTVTYKDDSVASRMDALNFFLYGAEMSVVSDVEGEADSANIRYVTGALDYSEVENSSKTKWHLNQDEGGIAEYQLVQSGDQNTEQPGIPVNAIADRDDNNGNNERMKVDIGIVFGNSGLKEQYASDAELIFEKDEKADTENTEQNAEQEPDIWICKGIQLTNEDLKSFYPTDSEAWKALVDDGLRYRYSVQGMQIDDSEQSDQMNTWYSETDYAFTDAMNLQLVGTFYADVTESRELLIECACRNEDQTDCDYFRTGLYSNGISSETKRQLRERPLTTPSPLATPGSSATISPSETASLMASVSPFATASQTIIPGSSATISPSETASLTASVSPFATASQTIIPGSSAAASTEATMSPSAATGSSAIAPTPTVSPTTDALPTEKPTPAKTP